MPRNTTAASVGALFKNNSKLLIMWPTMLSYVGASVAMSSNISSKRSRSNVISGERGQEVLDTIKRDAIKVHKYRPSGVSSGTMQKAVAASEAVTECLRAVQGKKSASECARKLADATQLCRNVAVGLNRDGDNHKKKRLTREQSTVYGMAFSVACILPLHTFTHVCDIGLLRPALAALRDLKSTHHYVGSLVTSLSPSNVVLMSAGIMQNKGIVSGMGSSITDMAKSAVKKMTLKGGAGAEGGDDGLQFLANLNEAIGAVQRDEAAAPFKGGESFVPSAADISLMSSANSGEVGITAGGVRSALGSIGSKIWSIGTTPFKVGKAVLKVPGDLVSGLWKGTKATAKFISRHWQGILIGAIVTGLLITAIVFAFGLTASATAAVATAWGSAGAAAATVGEAVSAGVGAYGTGTTFWSGLAQVMTSATGLGLRTSQTATAPGWLARSKFGQTFMKPMINKLPSSWANIATDGLGVLKTGMLSFAQRATSFITGLLTPVLEMLGTSTDSVFNAFNSFYHMGNGVAAWLSMLMLIIVGVIALALLWAVTEALAKSAKRKFNELSAKVKRKWRLRGQT